MRNPWVQIAQEVFEVSAPELAIELDVSEAEALSALVKLVPWALARCPDDEPPSENDLVEGPTAARKIARGVGYQGDPEAFCRAVARLRFPMLEFVEGGIRIRGLDRYDASWGDRNRSAWEAWKTYRAGKGPRPQGARSARRTSAEVPPEKRCPDPDPDPDPDHYPPHTPPFERPPAEVGGEKVDWGPVADQLVAWMVAERDALPDVKPSRRADRTNARDWALAWLAKHQPDKRQLEQMRRAFSAFLADDWARRQGASLSLWCSEGVWLPRWSDVRAADSPVRPPKKPITLAEATS